MKKINNKLSGVAIYLLLLVLATETVSAKSITYKRDTTEATSYLLMVEAFLENSSNLKFTSQRFGERYISSVTTRDTSYIYYYYNNGNYQTYLNGLKEVQNEQYSMVEESGWAIHVQKHRPIRISLLVYDLLDANFVNDYVDKMYTIDSSGYKKVKVEFKAGAPFMQYEMVFNTTRQIPLSIRYKSVIDDGTSTGGYEAVRLEFATPYTDATNMDTYFRTDIYFTRVNGELQLMPAYSSYHLIDLSSY